MKKFSESQLSIFDSNDPLDFKSLGMMAIIDDIFNENNYQSTLGVKQIEKFNYGIELLKKTSMVGTDIIVLVTSGLSPEDIGYKTVQVKNRINDWTKLSHYKVDWIAEASTIRIYNLKNKSILDIK